MTYSRTELKNAIWDTVIEKNAATQLDVNSVMNYGVREVIKDVDLRTTKRLSSVINVFNKIYDYTCPSDIKGIKIIDLVPQVNRSPSSEIELVPAEEFDRRKTFEQIIVAFNDHDTLRKLRASVVVDSDQVTISNLDTTASGGGLWTGYGDGQNVRADTANYVEGVGSLLWDIGSGGGTTAGIVNSTMNIFDITNYLLQGSFFLYVYIQSTTNLTNFKLRVGSSSANYYEMTVTVTNEGNAFSAGWNLLRFDLVNRTTTGTPNNAACNYVAMFMTKNAAKISEVNYRFDGLILCNGFLNQVLYYSKYGWQTVAGAYLENSTADTDLLNADTEEFNLIALRCKMESDRRLRDWNAYAIDKNDYLESKAHYLEMYPSEAKLLTQTYYDLQSTTGLNVDLNEIVVEPQEEIT